MEHRVKSERSIKREDHYSLKSAFEKKANDVAPEERVYGNEGRFTICAQ